MQDIIQLLPESLANQIAAGEVVQRPASVVKELMENSIDAGATEVSLIIKDAGKVLIQVVDNGCGMSETDARMSFERHATSKITKTDDLFHITTFGFRGEALASIAAVAQVEMKSRPAEEETGTQIIIEGSEVKSQEIVATPAGTSIAVKNLFFNVPARRKFLKSNAVEFRHILEEYTRVALANPSVGFQLFHNGQEHNTLIPGKLARRIVSLLGKNYQQQLIPVEEEVQDYKVQGYIGKPESAKKTRGDQYFFVNNRYIKHPYLNHAVMNAFEGLLPEESFPFYLLNILLDPEKVDVNVHPTKTEVKFEDEHTLYALVRAAVKQSIGRHGLTPSIDFAYNVNFGDPGFTERKTSSQPVSDTIENPTFPSKINLESGRSSLPSSSTAGGWQPSERPSRPNPQNWEQLYEIARKDLSNAPDEEEESSGKIQFDSSINHPRPATDHPTPSAMQVYGRYLLCQVKSGLMLIDQHAAHERILYEKYLQSMRSGEGVSQQLLFPKRLSMSLPELAILEEYKSEFEKLGFSFRILGEEVTITGVPAEIKGDEEEFIFAELVAKAESGAPSLDLQSSEGMAALMAKRTAIRPGKMMSSEEIQQLIGQLFATSNPNYTADGEKIMRLLEAEDLENFLLGRKRG